MIGSKVSIFFGYHPELWNEGLGCFVFQIFCCNFSPIWRVHLYQFPGTLRYGIYKVFVAFRNVPKQGNLVVIRGAKIVDLVAVYMLERGDDYLNYQLLKCWSVAQPLELALSAAPLALTDW